MCGLPEPRNDIQNTEIAAVASSNKYFWLGITYDRTSSVFRYESHNAEIQFEAWGTGQPKVSDNTTCVLMVNGPNVHVWNTTGWVTNGCDHHVGIVICVQPANWTCRGE